MKTVQTKSDYISNYENGLIFVATSGKRNIAMFETSEDLDNYLEINPTELPLNGDDIEETCVYLD